ncbi:hypothetical protein ACFOWE_12765 [Planomonospora corallina]|uniref:DUF5666 domain-containing protein n=1 Tax=Planomonospora corallina TaxID=1806052 RepID=A0ABV8I789_9ACTN
MRKHHLLAFSVAAGLTLGGVVAQPVLAAPAHAAVSASKWRPAPVKSVFRIGGTVAAVDATASTVAVAVPVAAGTTTTNVLPVAATAAVTVDGATATLADVPDGARIAITGTSVRGARTATKLAVTTTWSFRQDGTVVAVDAEASALTVRASNGVESAVPVAVDAAVVIDGVATALADVPAGARITVTGTVTNSVASAAKLVVTTTWSFRRDGTVVAVDAEASTLTIRAVNGVRSTVPVAADAAVTLNRTSSTLADVPAGAQAQITGTVTNGVASATKINAVKVVKKRR